MLARTEHKEIEVRDKLKQLQSELGVDSDEEVGGDEDEEESRDLFGSKHPEFKMYMRQKQYVPFSFHLLHSMCALCP